MKKWLYLGAMLFLLCFVLGQSLLDAGQSDGESLMFAKFLGQGLQYLGFSVALPELNHVLRKIAHYSEFALLAYFMCKWLSACGVRGFKAAWITLVLGVAVACLDEGLQLFSAGRSAQISDVFLDFAGVLSGIGLALAELQRENHKR